jgi:hydrogenase maturation protein HypF
MGRLFDGVAALVGLAPQVSFEGQAAMALEFAAMEEKGDKSNLPHSGPEGASHKLDLSPFSAANVPGYPMPVGEGTPAVIDWGPLVRNVLGDWSAGVARGRIAARFHHALAEAALTVAQRSGCSRVVLSGGCFQNALLARLVKARLAEAGFNVATHHQVPPGDGGIALGQILVAADCLQLQKG